MKNTIISGISELFCPHYCILCGKAGGILCDCCKKYNDFCQKAKCLACGNELVNKRCPSCELPFDCQFCVGSRKGALGKLIEIYKYHSVRAVAGVLANMLDQRIDGDYQIVPLPTIRRHVRERGFDHIGLIAKKTRFPVERVLLRNKNTVQVGANREERIRQAKEAYLAQKVRPDANYLLLDDVWTTGSSMLAAADVLKKAGAKRISAAIIARSN